MGSCLSSPKKSSGQQLGSVQSSGPAPVTRRGPVPTQGPGRTLAEAEPGTLSPEDARRAAAEAAQSRLQNSNGKSGVLGTQLERERRQNRSTLLQNSQNGNDEPLVYD